jgi:hypothetical protein
MRPLCTHRTKDREKSPPFAGEEVVVVSRAEDPRVGDSQQAGVGQGVVDRLRAVHHNNRKWLTLIPLLQKNLRGEGQDEETLQRDVAVDSVERDL